MKAELGFRYEYMTGFLPFMESDDGRYWVADTGNAIHRAENCGYLWASKNEIKDPTRTLVYRVLRGDVITGPLGYRIVWPCLLCVAVYGADPPSREELKGVGV